MSEEKMTSSSVREFGRIHLTELFEMAIRQIGLRETVLRAAKVQGLSRKEICRRMGICPGTMYRHFQSRSTSLPVKAKYYWALFLHEQMQQIRHEHGLPSEYVEER